MYVCRETKPKVQKIDAFLSAGRTCNVDRATKMNDKIARSYIFHCQTGDNASRVERLIEGDTSFE